MSSVQLNTQSRRELRDLLERELKESIEAVQTSDATYAKRMAKIDHDALVVAAKNLGIEKEYAKLLALREQRDAIDEEMEALDRKLKKKMPFDTNHRYHACRKGVDDAVHEQFEMVRDEMRSKDKTVQKIAKLKQETTRKMQLLQTCKTEQDLFDKGVVKKR
jgi:hypothetical protein